MLISSTKKYTHYHIIISYTHSVSPIIKLFRNIHSWNTTQNYNNLYHYMEIQINITLKLSTDYNLRWIYDPVYDKLEVQGGSDPHKIWHCSDVDSYIRCVFTMSGRRRYFWHRGNKITELHPNKDYIPSFPSAEGVFYRNHSKKRPLWNHRVRHRGGMWFRWGAICPRDW